MLLLLACLGLPLPSQAAPLAQACTTVVFGAESDWDSAAHGVDLTTVTIRQTAGEPDSIEIWYQDGAGQLRWYGMLPRTLLRLTTHLRYVLRDTFEDAAFQYCPLPTATAIAPTSTPTMPPATPPPATPTATPIPPAVRQRYRVAIPIAGWGVAGI